MRIIFAEVYEWKKIQLDISVCRIYNFFITEINAGRGLQVNINDIFLKRPASVFGEKWRDGTPLGNGLTGINMYGGASCETFIVSRHDMWSTVGERLDEAPDVSGCIDEMRNLAENGEYAKASVVMYNRFKELGYKPAAQHMRCLCRVDFHFECPGVYSDYTRCLHMESAEAEITYSVDGKKYRRRTFVSRDTDITVSQFEFEKPISFTADAGFYESHEDGREDHIKNVHIENERYDNKDGFYAYTSMNDDGTFCGIVMKIVADGSVSISEKEIVVDKTNKALVYIKAFSQEKERETAISKAIYDLVDYSDSYEVTFSTHSKAHKKLYNSSDLSLYKSKKYHSNEELLMMARDKECSLELIEKLWRFGRYLFISGCNENGNPFPLYGLWVSGYDRTWSQYVANENVEMTYWHTTVGNLNTLVRPLIKYYFGKMDKFRECAKNLYGCNGIYVSVYTTPENSSPVHGVPVLFHFMGAGGWLARHFYDYYLATGDEELLNKEILPFMLGVAEFYEDYIYENKNGELVMYPSVSPENTPREYMNVDLGLGHPMPVYKNAVIEFAIMKELLRNLISLSENHPEIAAKAEKWKEITEKIPDYIINEDGAVAEWIDKEIHDNYFHRHLSHIYPLFPGTEIEDDARFELIPNFEKAVDLRELGSYTGWSLAHMSSIYARLGRGEKAFETINMLTKVCLLENFFTLHNDFRAMGITTDRMGDERFAPVQLDAVMGTVNAIQEWLIRITKKKIYVLPACPKKLKCGTAKNLGIFGGKISFEWDLAANKIEVDIKAERDVDFQVILPFGKPLVHVSLKKGEKQHIC